MNKFQSYAIRHPLAVGLIFAGLTGWCGYCAFRGGMATAVLLGDTARNASEALGG